MADRATALDHSTFGPLTEPLRRDLLLHCYRFTGSVHDAEDLVQETLARAWRGRGEYRGDAGLRTWLHRIATRVCLDSLRRRRAARRTLPSALRGATGEEQLWLEPLPDDYLGDADADPASTYDVRESVSLAFLTAIQLLPPRQRAVLLLRDVLALRAEEVASVLETSTAAVNSLLHRARRTMRDHYRRPPSPSSAEPQTIELLRRYVNAWEAGDVGALLSILKTDAILEMPPIPTAAIGHAAIRAFLERTVLDGTRGRWHGVTTEANGGPAVALYRRENARYVFTGLQLLAMGDGKVGTVTAYMDAGLARRFHLPATLEVRDRC